MIQEKVFLVSNKYSNYKKNTINCINSFIHILTHKIKLLKLNELLMSVPLNLYKSIKDFYVKDINKINKITLGLKSHCSWDSLIQDMDKKGFINIIYYQESRFRQNMKNKLCFCLQPHFL
jgi:hypothetical protein